MHLLIEIFKLIFYTLLIVFICKYILVKVLRKLAENLNLKPKTVGNITGGATSVPEFLTSIFSASSGFIATSIYNIISSNIINLVQYLFSIIINKNLKFAKNRAIKIDIIMAIITIILPILIVILNIEVNLSIVPIFILLLMLFYYINNNTHKLYLKKEEHDIDEEIKEETKWVKGKKRITIRYSIYLILTTIVLFITGNLLSEVLEDLCVEFNIPELILGILLGFMTSLPELITFFESQKHYKKENKNELGVVEATNNLLTSNLLNLFVIQTISIIIYSLVA